VAKKKYFYVINFGGLWRLSAASYKRLLKTIAAGKEYNLDDLGIMLSSSVVNALDLSCKDAKRMLDLMEDLHLSCEDAKNILGFKEEK
jgi:hypothetical protein